MVIGNNSLNDVFEEGKELTLKSSVDSNIYVNCINPYSCQNIIIDAKEAQLIELDGESLYSLNEAIIFGNSSNKILAQCRESSCSNMIIYSQSASEVTVNAVGINGIMNSSIFCQNCESININCHETTNNTGSCNSVSIFFPTNGNNSIINCYGNGCNNNDTIGIYSENGMKDVSLNYYDAMCNCIDLESCFGNIDIFCGSGYPSHSILNYNGCTNYDNINDCCWNGFNALNISFYMSKEYCYTTTSNIITTTKKNSFTTKRFIIFLICVLVCVVMVLLFICGLYIVKRNQTNKIYLHKISNNNGQDYQFKLLSANNNDDNWLDTIYSGISLTPHTGTRIEMDKTTQTNTLLKPPNNGDNNDAIKMNQKRQDVSSKLESNQGITQLGTPGFAIMSTTLEYGDTDDNINITPKTSMDNDDNINDINIDDNISDDAI